MADLIIVAVLLVIVGAAVAYIVKLKKSGVKCIGCPSGATCSHNCGSCGGCGSAERSETECACHTDTKE